MSKLLRNLSTPEARAFWAQVEVSARSLDKLPAWVSSGVYLDPPNVHALRGQAKKADTAMTPRGMINPRGVSVVKRGPNKWLVRWRFEGFSRQKIVHGTREAAEEFADSIALGLQERHQSQHERAILSKRAEANGAERVSLALNATVLEKMLAIAAQRDVSLSRVINEALSWFLRIREISVGSTPRLVHCTEVAAIWCPVCGDCKCPRNDVGERTLEDARCPLHAVDSSHAERS
jgi:hypothetical protein